MEVTPVDQTQQSEDANLRKVVAQLHVNLGHPSNDALARASDCLEDLMTQSRQQSMGRCTVCERLTEPLFLPLLSDVGQNSDNVWHLISSCLQTSLGNTVCFLNMFDMASYCQVVFPLADKNPFNG